MATEKEIIHALNHSMPAAAKAQLGQFLHDIQVAVAELQTLQTGVTQPTVTPLGTRTPVK